MKNIIIGLILGVGITLAGHYLWKKQKHSIPEGFRTGKFLQCQAAKMEQDFVRKLDANYQIGGVTFPKTLTIEKKYLQSMLRLLGNQEGGIIIYPAINNNQFTLVMTTAEFDTDKITGDIVSAPHPAEVVTVKYIKIGGREFCYEAINPCPNYCPTAATDLHLKDECH